MWIAYEDIAGSTVISDNSTQSKWMEYKSVLTQSPKVDWPIQNFKWDPNGIGKKMLCDTTWLISIRLYSVNIPDVTLDSLYWQLALFGTHPWSSWWAWHFHFLQQQSRYSHHPYQKEVKIVSECNSHLVECIHAISDTLLHITIIPTLVINYYHNHKCHPRVTLCC